MEALSGRERIDPVLEFVRQFEIDHKKNRDKFCTVLLLVATVVILLPLFKLVNLMAAVLLAEFVIAQLFTEALSNGTTLVLLMPIATELAKGLHLNPMAFIFAIVFAASQ